MRAQAQRLIAKRLGLAPFKLSLVSAAVFGMTGLLPGDAAQQATSNFAPLASTQHALP